MKSIYAHLPHQLNVASYLLESELLEERKDSPAYLFRDGSLSFRQVQSYTRRMAALLHDMGLAWEQRVALLLPDSPELVIAFWGSVWAGAVAVPINTAYRPEDILYILKDCRARVIVTNRAWRDQFAEQFAACQARLIIIDEAPRLLSILDSVTEEPEAASTTRDDVAFWLYTSGSTGKPKGAIHLHHDMLVSTELYAKNILGMQANDIIYSIARIPFAYGLGNTLYMPLAVGAAAVLSDAVNAFDTIEDIHLYRPTIFFGIPSVYSELLHVQELAPLDASSLRLCVSAAEQLPPTVWERWKTSFGLEICEGIGTTELLHIFLSNAPGQCKPGSSGRCVPGYTVRVVDEDGKLMPAGMVGDLEVGGESLMQGYWNRHQETREAIFGDYMKTGDKYLMDEDGYYYFAGRHDDRFRIHGQWVLPFEIEDVLLQFPDVLDAAVVPEVDEEKAQACVVAYITLKPGTEASPELEHALKKHAKHKLPHFKSPQKIVFLEAIQRTATGKIDRKHLRLQTSHMTREVQNV